ncbi:MAG TPA: hypothetical protein VK622_06700 [Puia sp.]|nr:hypothetical protein [Puia sp.]
MEVHHHPDLHHRKKKWKEYVLEFLMIFLAVTLGFFAETIREHISENHREKDYIIGLINNIQNDTSDLKGLIYRNDLELSGIDSLMSVSKNNFTNMAVQDSIFYYATQHTITLHLFSFNDLTLVQLRNAGGYSVIKESRVADSIALYEAKNNDIKIQERFVTDYYVQTWTSFKQIMDGTKTNKFFHSYEATGKIPSDIDVIISKDEEKMSLLYNNYWTFTITLKGYDMLLKEHLQYLSKFILFLKRSYDIE